MPQVDQTKDLIAEQSAEIDEIAEKAEPTHLKTSMDLQLSPINREPGLWAEAWKAGVEVLGVSFEEWLLLTTEDYANMPQSPIRDLLWATMIAAAIEQANMPVMREVIPVASVQADQQIEQAAKAGPEDLKIAAKEGVGNDRFKAAKERRRGNNVI
jgi:hypothetical protein